MGERMSRRSFLGLGAAAAVVAGTTGLVGCSPKEASDGNEAANVVSSGIEDVEWAKETDVVIVGFGGAGSAAAIEAKRAGAEVVLLEELDNPGGSTVACGGQIMMAGTKLQEKFGIEDNVDNYYAYMCAAAGDNANYDAIKVVCDHSSELYDWCVECGMDFESGSMDLERHMGGTKAGLSLGYSGNEQARAFANIVPPAPRGHMPQPNSSGQDIFAALQSTVESLGIEILTSTPARRLVTDSSGRVVGVVAENDKGEYPIKARKAVVLTAGGFGNNEDMLNAYYPFPNKRGTIITAGGNENGSGIRMGQAIGADTYGMGCFQIGKAISSMADVLGRGVLVDSNARRIVAEDEYNSFLGRAIIMAPTKNCYYILDEATAEEGVAEKVLGKPLAVADSIEGLAEAIGIDADGMKATFDTYNAAAAAGVDDEFGKAARYLSPFETGPFHAYACGSETCYTASCGGLKIDTDARVINLDGEVIPGLYAAGRNTGTIYGWYMGSGSSMADVLTFGRIAGKNAAAESPESE